MSTHYLAELPIDGYRLDGRTMIVTSDVFDMLADYTRSIPTGPKAGRVYKKNMGWAPEHPDWWWAFICEVDAKVDMIAHVPHKLVLAPGGVLPEVLIPENRRQQYRYAWNALERRWMRTSGHQRMPYEQGYTDQNRVDPSNKFVGPMSKPMTDAVARGLLLDMLKRRRIREANLSRPLGERERFSRRLDVAS